MTFDTEGHIPTPLHHQSCNIHDYTTLHFLIKETRAPLSEGFHVSLHVFLIRVMFKIKVSVEQRCNDDNEILKRKPCEVSLCSPQMSQELAWDRRRGSDVTGQRMTTRGTARSVTWLGLQTFVTKIRCNARLGRSRGGKGCVKHFKTLAVQQGEIAGAVY